MGWRGILALVLLAAGLGLALWLTDRQPRGEDGISSAALDGRRLLDARRLVIATQSGLRPLEFENDGRRWQLVEPLRDLASMATLNSIADAYDSARLLSFRATTTDATWLRANGFAPYESSLTVTWADGATITLELGGPGSLGDDLFVRKDQQVFRGGTALKSVLQGTPDDYREHLVCQNVPAQVRRLTIQRRLQAGGDDTTTLALGPGREWLLEQPVRARADAMAANELVASLAGMRVDRFLTSNIGVTALPDFVVTIEGDGGKETIELWRQAKELLGLHRPRMLEFALESPRYPQLLGVPLQMLRSKMLLPGPLERLVRIKLARGNGDAIRFERGATELRLVEPIDVACEPTATNEMLSALRNLYAQEFAEDGSARGGFDRALRVELTDQFGAAPVVILIGDDDPADQDLTFARRADETWVMKVPRGAAEVLRRPWTTYVSRKAARANLPDDVTRLQVVRGETTREYRRVAGHWQRAADGASVSVLTDVIDELRDGAAEAVHDARDRGEPAFTVILQRENGDETDRLEFFTRDQALLLRLPGRQPAVLFQLKQLVAQPLRELAQ